MHFDEPASPPWKNDPKTPYSEATFVSGFFYWHEVYILTFNRSFVAITYFCCHSKTSSATKFVVFPNQKTYYSSQPMSRSQLFGSASQSLLSNWTVTLLSHLTEQLEMSFTFQYLKESVTYSKDLLPPLAHVPQPCAVLQTSIKHQ